MYTVAIPPLRRVKTVKLALHFTCFTCGGQITSWAKFLQHSVLFKTWKWEDFEAHSVHSVLWVWQIDRFDNHRQRVSCSHQVSLVASPQPSSSSSSLWRRRQCCCCCCCWWWWTDLSVARQRRVIERSTSHHLRCRTVYLRTSLQALDTDRQTDRPPRTDGQTDGHHYKHSTQTDRPPRTDTHTQGHR